ncbi:MAG TPA: hypothetical protein PK156_04595 [Polyangium sp.]|nr:hypothetical protein [Polyangium sp.]
MSRDVTAVILCEDLQSQVLLRRYLKARGFARIRVLPLPASCGEQYVRDTYAREVKGQRTSSVTQVLVVHIDADNNSVQYRHDQLARKLVDDDLAPRGTDEPIAIVVPRYETETWLHHYVGRGSVVETEKYPKFSDNQAAAAIPTVNALLELVDGKIEAPANLPSLARAIVELRRLP